MNKFENSIEKQIHSKFSQATIMLGKNVATNGDNLIKDFTKILNVAP